MQGGRDSLVLLGIEEVAGGTQGGRKRLRKETGGENSVNEGEGRF